METAMSELSSEAKALIRRVGTADGPRPFDRARVKRRLVAALAGAGTAVGGGGTIASGAPAAFGAAVTGKVTVGAVVLWLAVGAGLGTAVSTPAVISAYRRAEPARAVAVVAAPATLPPLRRVASEASRAPSAPEVAAKPAEPDAPSTEVARKSVPVAPVPRVVPGAGGEVPVARAAAETPVPAPPLGAASLAEETRLLQAAQRELARKNTSAALALLDEHATRFPNGALAPERSAARVLALCDLGRSAEARRAAEAFVQAAPRSPLVPRLRDSCALSGSSAYDDRE